MAPRVLVSDKLSKTAVQIFKDHGIDVDYQPDLSGLDYVDTHQFAVRLGFGGDQPIDARHRLRAITDLEDALRLL